MVSVHAHWFKIIIKWVNSMFKRSCDAVLHLWIWVLREKLFLLHFVLVSCGSLKAISRPQKV